MIKWTGFLRICPSFVEKCPWASLCSASFSFEHVISTMSTCVRMPNADYFITATDLQKKFLELANKTPTYSIPVGASRKNWRNLNFLCSQLLLCLDPRKRSIWAIRVKWPKLHELPTLQIFMERVWTESTWFRSRQHKDYIHLARLYLSCYRFTSLLPSVETFKFGRAEQVWPC